MCWFGADRCGTCEAEAVRASTVRRAKATHDPLAALPDDALETIARECGATLPAFASVSKAVRSVVRPALWREAYEAASGGPVTCGDAMPPALWLACLLKDDLKGQA